MSDNLLRIIPDDPNWIPTDTAAKAALDVLRRIAPRASPINFEVQITDEIVFVDQGGNFETLHCPACSTELENDWWSDRMNDAWRNHFTDLAIVTPCCGAHTSLNTLDYRWPAGFSRFVLAVMNPDRGWLSEDELGDVARALGQPVRQIMAHY